MLWTGSRLSARVETSRGIRGTGLSLSPVLGPSQTGRELPFLSKVISLLLLLVSSRLPLPLTPPLACHRLNPTATPDQR